MSAFTHEEFLAATLARLVSGSRTIAVGSNSPIPAAATFLAQELAAQPVAVSILGSARHNPFTDGGRELFDFAAQGRLDSFFLGGGQIDGNGNVNLVGIGGYPASPVRFPGCYGSAYLYSLVPNVILFREEHSPRVLVPSVDFVSAAGKSAGFRPGGPTHLVTGRAVFRFVEDRFVLASLHPGETLDGVRAATGFAFHTSPDLNTTPRPTPRELDILRGPVALGLADLYPRFVARAFKDPCHA
jgi:glutaconate CoA-transferase subunit B